MNFSSDNWAGAHPSIAGALTREAGGVAAAYGASDLDRDVEATFNAVFERDVTVFFVATGTAANALAMAAINRPGGVAFCHREAHLIADEGGAPQFLAPGLRLVPVDGRAGKIGQAELEGRIGRYPPDIVHAGRPVAVSISQSTEVGVVYTPGEIAAVSGVCRRHGLPLHMDGARFANALAHLGVSPAEISWRAGVDLLSLGATKNGCWCAEALVVFDPALANDLPGLRKRSGQLFSKTRFVAAQFGAWFQNGLWLDLTAHANRMATDLQAVLEASPNARMLWRTQTNEVFPALRRETAAALRDGGALFHDWPPPHDAEGRLAEDEMLTRFVTSFATGGDEIAAFADLLGR